MKIVFEDTIWPTIKNIWDIKRPIEINLNQGGGTGYCSFGADCKDDDTEKTNIRGQNHESN